MTRKKVLIMVCMMLLMMAAIPFFAAYANRQPLPSVIIDGQVITFADQGAVMVNDRVLVPARGVFEHMGFTVTWHSQSRIARLESYDTVIFIPADLSSFIVNGTIITPDVPQQMMNDRLMLPLRAIAEALGATAEWDASNRVARITSAQVMSETALYTMPAPAVYCADDFDNTLYYDVLNALVLDEEICFEYVDEGYCGYTEDVNG